MDITLNGVELPVEYDYYKGYRGKRDSYGCPEEPDEPESIDITDVSVAGNSIFEILNDSILAKIEGIIWNELKQY